MMIDPNVCGSERMDDMVNRGIVPKNCKRIRIDIAMDNVTEIIFTCIAEREQIKEILGITDNKGDGK